MNMYICIYRYMYGGRGRERERERERDRERASHFGSNRNPPRLELSVQHFGSKELQTPAEAMASWGEWSALVSCRIAMDPPECSDRKGDGGHNKHQRERCSEPTRGFRDVAGHLRGSVSTLDAVSCTGVLPNRVSQNHSYRSGEDELGEGVCVALGESRIKGVGPRGLVATGGIACLSIQTQRCASYQQQSEGAENEAHVFGHCFFLSQGKLYHQYIELPLGWWTRGTCSSRRKQKTSDATEKSDDGKDDGEKSKDNLRRGHLRARKAQ